MDMARIYYEDPRTNSSPQIPCHADINEMVERAIIRFFHETTE